MDNEERAARHSRGGRQNLTREQLLDLLDGHESMQWPQEAHRLQQQRNAALVALADLRAGVEHLLNLPGALSRKDFRVLLDGGQ